jgi:hypothetical protein
MKSYSLRFRKQIGEVFVIQPNELGNSFLNFLFKKSTAYLKRFPFLYLLPAAVIIVFFIYLFLGKGIVTITSFLQYGF